MAQQKLDFKVLPKAEMLARSQSFLASIVKRRTVRDFSSQTVDPEIIENAIKAAASAPSGANKQPWFFVAVGDPATKKTIRDAAEKEEKQFYESRAPQEWLDDLKVFETDANKPFLETAPYLIAVFLQRNSIDEQGNKHKNYYMPESVGIATGFLLAALHDAGLATLTHTPSPMKFLNTILGRPDNEKPYMLIVVGYPAKDATVPDITRKPFAEVAKFI